MSEGFDEALDKRQTEYWVHVADNQAQEQLVAEQARLREHYETERRAQQKTNQPRIAVGMRDDARKAAARLDRVQPDAVVSVTDPMFYNRSFLRVILTRNVPEIQKSLWMVSKQKIASRSWEEGPRHGPGSSHTYRLIILDDTGDLFYLDKTLANIGSSRPWQPLPDKLTPKALMSDVSGYQIKPLPDEVLAPLEAIPEVIDPTNMPQVVHKWRSQLLNLLSQDRSD